MAYIAHRANTVWPNIEYVRLPQKWHLRLVPLCSGPHLHHHYALCMSCAQWNFICTYISFISILMHHEKSFADGWFHCASVCSSSSSFCFCALAFSGFYHAKTSELPDVSWDPLFNVLISVLVFIIIRCFHHLPLDSCLSKIIDHVPCKIDKFTLCSIWRFWPFSEAFFVTSPYLQHFF